MKKPKAFTLIELLVVIAIIALLLSIVVPAIGKAKDVVKRTVCGSNIRQIGVALRSYAEENDDQPMPMFHLGGSNPGARYDPSAASAAARVTNVQPNAYNAVIAYSANQVSGGEYLPFHLAVLFEQGYFENPEGFYCPAQPKNTNFAMHYDYDFYVQNGSWGTWIPTENNPNGFLRTSYNYWTYDKKRYSQLGIRPVVVDNLQDWAVVPHRKNRTAEAAPQGVSALFADGHVSFCGGEEIFSSETWNNRNVIDDRSDNGPGDHLPTFEKILRAIQGHQ